MNSDFSITDLVLKYINDDLTVGEKKKVKKLIETDPETAAIYKTILSLQAEGKRTDWIKLRKSIRTLSSQMFDDFRKIKQSRRPNRGVRIFDSKAMPLPEGVRPAIVDCRRLKYKINDLMLELSVYPISISAYEIIGQLTGYEGDDCLDFVFVSGKNKISVRGDKFHLFRFAKVPISEYTIKIYHGRKIIGTVGLDL